MFIHKLHVLGFFSLLHIKKYKNPKLNPQHYLEVHIHVYMYEPTKLDYFLTKFLENTTIWSQKYTFKFVYGNFMVQQLTYYSSFF